MPATEEKGAAAMGSGYHLSRTAIPTLVVRQKPQPSVGQSTSR